MNHTFHCHLRKSFSWYHNWHNHPRHHHTHWLSFIVTVFLFASFISSGITDFYNENNYVLLPVAHAQTGVTGYYQGQCPAGYIAVSGSQARASSWTQDTPTMGIVCDDDGVFNDPNGAQSFGVTYPLQALLHCGNEGNTGTAFVTTSGPCNSEPSNPASRPGWRWDPGTGQPIGVNLIAQVQCGPGGGQVNVTIPDANHSAGAWTSSPNVTGEVCVQGTLITRTPSMTRYIYYIYPDRAPVGVQITIAGQNLSTSVQFLDSTGARTTVLGNMNPDQTEVTLLVPDVTPGNYTIRVGPDTVDVSNEVPFTVVAGPIPGPTASDPPVINTFNPRRVSQGGTLEIYGENLTPTVRFTDGSAQSTIVLGWVSNNLDVVTVGIPLSMPPVNYNVAIVGPNGTATTPLLLVITPATTNINPAAVPVAVQASSILFEDLMSNVLTYSVYGLGVAVFIMIFYAGFLWMTSAANPGNIALAKRYITNAILGAVLLLSSYIILYTINPGLVSGTFALPTIAPLPSTTILPPPSGTPPPGGSSQTAAQNLIATMGLNNFSNVADCGGNFHARQNIQDVSSGLYPAVCSPTCACVTGGTSGSVNISPTILNGLAALWNSGVRFTVGSLTTGRHSAGSDHYRGTGVDITINSQDPNEWVRAVDFLIRNYSGNIFCETASGNSDTDCSPIGGTGVDHIHWGM